MEENNFSCPQKTFGTDILPSLSGVAAPALSLGSAEPAKPAKYQCQMFSATILRI
jgi:hypothetical protein